MKRFRIGFLAIIAVMAIGLTAATESDVVKKALIAPVTCTQNVDFYAIKLASTGFWHYNPSFPAPPTPNSTACIASPACAIDALTLPTTIVCPNSGNIFCCAKLKSPNDCPAGETKYDVFCKP